MEAKIELKLDELKADHMKTIEFLDTNIPDITSNKTSSPSEQPSHDIIEWPLLKPPETYSHASQFTKNPSSLNLECDSKNGGMKLDPHSDSTCQQTRYRRHRNNSN